MPQLIKISLACCAPEPPPNEGKRSNLPFSHLFRAFNSLLQFEDFCKPCGLTGTSRNDRDGAKILNGSDLGAGDAPWQVAIVQKNWAGWEG